MKRFVLVTALVCTPGLPDVKASGIKKLKREAELATFVDEYLHSIGVQNFESILREDSIAVIKPSEDGDVYTWHFAEYQEDELFTAVAHLTRDELLRDLKILLPLKEVV